MRETGRAMRHPSDDGFTLIELMVVVLIISVLIAIAIPTFLAARSRAEDRTVQSNLRTALTSAKSVFSNSDDYSTADATALSANETALAFVDGTAASDSPHTVSVKPESQSVILVALSKSNTCFAVKDDVAPGSTGTAYATVTGDCTADNADSSVSTWNAAW